MAQVNAGRVRFVSRGEYSNATQYYTFDLVNYNGSSYYAKENTLGDLPTDSTKWQLVAEKGNKGDIGPIGVGIQSITKTSTSGLVDTYTITYTNGSTTTFNVNNGKGIVSITKVLSQDNIDTYRITYNDGTTFDYQIENGSVTQTQFDDLQDRVQDLERNQKTGEATGTEIDLTDAFDTKPRYLEIDATETTQETTTGKNLLNVPSAFVVTGNIQVNVSIPANTQFTINMESISLGDTHSSLIQYRDANNNTISTNAIDSSNLTHTRTLTSAVASLMIYSQNNYANSQGVTTTFNKMMVTTSNDTSYEPYTGGQVSPSPEFPQDVETMVGYRNLFDQSSSNILNVSRITWASDVAQFVNLLNTLPVGTYKVFYKIKFDSLDSSTGNRTIGYRLDNSVSGNITNRINITAIVGNVYEIKDNIEITNDNKEKFTHFYLYSKQDGAGINDYSTTYDFQLTEGTEEKPYVLYGTNYMVLDEVGKNKFDKDNATRDKILSWANGDLTNNNNSITSNFIKIKNENNICSNFKFVPFFYDKNKNYLGWGTQLRTSSGSSSSAKFIWEMPNNSEICYYRIAYLTGANDNIDMKLQNIMLEKGTTATPYEPYQHMQFPISLANQELLNKSDYVDKIIVDETNEQAYIEKVWGKVVLDGSEHINAYSDKDTDNYYCYWIYAPDNIIAEQSILNLILCNYFKESTWTNIYSKISDTPVIALRNNKRFYFRTSQSTANDFKQYITTQYNNGNPVEVYYVLAEPQLIPIDNPNIKLLNGANHITNSEGAEMDIVYVKDINLYLDSINARLEALENANQGE